MKSSVHPCAAVILAAGASARMGSPKALLKIGGQTFLDRLVEVFSLFCDPVITVLGQDEGRIRAGIVRSAETRFLINPSPEKGMISSLQEGLAAVPDNCRSVFFHPCDMPLVHPRTIGLLLEALSACDAEILAAVPTLDGRRGHPVLIRAEWIPAFLALEPGATAKELLESVPGAVVEAPVQDEAVRQDFDTPEQYSGFFGGGGEQ